MYVVLIISWCINLTCWRSHWCWGGHSLRLWGIGDCGVNHLAAPGLFFCSMSTCLKPHLGSTWIWWEITLLDIDTTWIQIVCDGWYNDKRLCVHHSHKEHVLRIFSISVYKLIFWIIPPLLALWNTNNCHSKTVKSHMCGVLLVGCMLLCSILLEDLCR